ncbi:MFS transporter [Porticoccaceae bacterium]|nr:MFS transporter [Porticoccaceae bacterium]
MINNLQNKLPFLTGVVLMVCGVSGANFRAFLLGALVGDVGITDAQASDVIAANATGILIGSVVMVLKVHIWNRRYIAWSAISCMLVGNFLGLFFHQYQQLLMILFLNGLGEGILMSLGAAVIAGSKDATKFIGIHMILGTSTATVMALSAPYLIQWQGISGIFLFLLMFPGLALLSTRWLSSFVQAPTTQPQAVNSDRAMPAIDMRAAVLSIIATLVLFTGLGAFWPFCETIVNASNVSSEIFGKAVSVGMFSGGVVAVAAAWYGNSFGFLKPALLGCVVTSLVAYFATYQVSEAATFLIIPGYLMSSMLVIIFHNAFLASLDTQGRVLVFGVTMESLGGVLGPILAGSILRLGFSYEVICWALIIAVFCYLLLRILCLVNYENGLGEINANAVLSGGKGK